MDGHVAVLPVEAIEGDGSLFNPPAIASMLLYSLLYRCPNAGHIREQGRDARGECGCAERDQVIVKIVQFGDDDRGFNAGVRASPCEAFGGAFTLAVVVAGDDEAGNAGRRREDAETSGLIQSFGLGR